MASICRMCWTPLGEGQQVVRDSFGDYHLHHLAMPHQAQKQKEGNVYTHRRPKKSSTEGKVI